MISSILKVIGEGLDFLNRNIFTAKKRAKNLEEEKQEALQKARGLAHGDDEKAMEKHIRNLPD